MVVTSHLDFVVNVNLENLLPWVGHKKCEDCHETYGWIWISLAIFFGLSLFIIFLILLKLDIMSYYIGGCLYSYQLLYCFYAPEMGKYDNFFINPYRVI